MISTTGRATQGQNHYKCRALWNIYKTDCENRSDLILLGSVAYNIIKWKIIWMLELQAKVEELNQSQCEGNLG